MIAEMFFGLNNKRVMLSKCFNIVMSNCNPMHLCHKMVDIGYDLNDFS